MRKEHVLAVLCFGSLWGLSEAVLGGVLYRAHIAHASIPLAVVGFVVLTAARSYWSAPGSATAIAACAMLYKFLNCPFFGCHLLGILALGVAYDMVRHGLGIKNEPLFAAAATYLGFALFALTITYVVRYEYWTAEGAARVLRHIAWSGTLAAIANVLAVPLTVRLAERLGPRLTHSFVLRPRFSAGALSAVMALLWLLALTATF